MKLFGIFFVAAIFLFGFSFAAGVDDVTNAVGGLCNGVKGLLPIAAMLMVVLAGVIYAAGQIMGAETRARANVWATACLTGALISVLIVVIAPAVLGAIYPGVGGCEGCTIDNGQSCGEGVEGCCKSNNCIGNVCVACAQPEAACGGADNPNCCSGSCTDGFCSAAPQGCQGGQVACGNGCVDAGQCCNNGAGCGAGEVCDNDACVAQCSDPTPQRCGNSCIPAGDACCGPAGNLQGCGISGACCGDICPCAGNEICDAQTSTCSAGGDGQRGALCGRQGDQDCGALLACNQQTSICGGDGNRGAACDDVGGIDDAPCADNDVCRLDANDRRVCSALGGNNEKCDDATDCDPDFPACTAGKCGAPICQNPNPCQNNYDAVAQLPGECCAGTDYCKPSGVAAGVPFGVACNSQQSDFNGFCNDHADCTTGANLKCKMDGINPPYQCRGNAGYVCAPDGNNNNCWSGTCQLGRCT